MLGFFNFDETNTEHMAFFGEMVAKATQMGVKFQIGTNTDIASNTDTVNQPSKKTKTYAPATDVQCQYILDGTKVAYALLNGSYVGQTAVRKVLNKRLREAKAVASDKVKIGTRTNADGSVHDVLSTSYKFSSKAKALEFVEKELKAHVPGNTPEEQGSWLSENNIDAQYYTVVTADEINDVREKAQARDEKKTQKNAQ